MWPVQELFLYSLVSLLPVIILEGESDCASISCGIDHFGQVGAGGSHSCARSHRRRTFSHSGHQFGWCLTRLCRYVFSVKHVFFLSWPTNLANSSVCPPLVNKHLPCIHIVNPCFLPSSLFYLTICRTCSRWWCRVPISTRPPLYLGVMVEQQRASSPPAPSKVCLLPISSSAPLSLFHWLSLSFLIL